jgi:hypothetical protein
LFILFFFLLFIPDLSYAFEKNIALLIGNGHYFYLHGKASALSNPINDVTSMEKILERIGFEVMILKNEKHSKIKKAISIFSKKINKGQVGLFFFAGHAVQIDGLNYLLTKDSKIDFKKNRITEKIDVEKLLTIMEASQNSSNIIILDACRENPFESKGHKNSHLFLEDKDGNQENINKQEHGLAKMSAPNGSIIAYSSAPNSVAKDNPNGKYSIYTKHLLDVISIPNLTINTIFTKVGKRVKKSSQNKQNPWIVSSLTTDIVINSEKKKTIFFKISENNKKSRLSFDTLQNILKLAGFNIVNNIKLADYVLDVEINTHSADKPVMEDLDLYAQFADIYLTVNDLKTKKILYSSSSSGVTPHIDAFQGKKIAINIAIDKFKTDLIASLINN